MIASVCYKPLPLPSFLHIAYLYLFLSDAFYNKKTNNTIIIIIIIIIIINLSNFLCEIEVS
jgi:hypothetical protein